MEAVPLIKKKNNQTEKQGIQIIEPMQIREQDIKKRLSHTSTSNQGNNIKLQILGIFQALGNKVSKQGKRKGTQGAHYKFMFREKENG